MSLEVGMRVSHYELVEHIGAGGMGVVFKARDLNLDRFVAIKFLPPHPDDAREHELRQRFVQEAKAASALDHPNIGTIHEIDETEDGRMFIVMTFYDGQTLQHRMRHAPLPIPEVIDRGVQIARGLAQAHAKSIVHRDIKPGNVLVTTDGTVKIIDFGLAILGDETRMTTPGTAVGTLAYMAPEQVRSEPGDPRVDAWALGIVLYEMLCGRTPFRGEHAGALTHAIVTDEPEPVASLRPDVPAELAHLVDDALRKEASERPDSEAILGRLEALQNPELGSAETVQLPVPERERGARVRVVAIAFGVLGLFAAFAWVTTRLTTPERSAADVLAEARQRADAGDYRAAFVAATEAERMAPDDPALAELWPLVSEIVDFNATPADADVFTRPYASADTTWTRLGRTPLEDVRVPAALMLYRFEKPGYDSALRASTFDGELSLEVGLAPSGTVPAEMVRVDGGRAFGWLAGINPFTDFTLDAYLIDRFEVTNADYKRFVDAGGYDRDEFWQHAFEKDGRTLSRQEAMAAFVDATGRPGPATWELGTYPDGQADHPVSGVSWYEAAAYAAFADKSLPTLFHWVLASGTWYSNQITPHSQFGASGPVAVGSRGGMGPYGTYDMAGNVREWCSTDSGRGRYIPGGAWDDDAYMFRNASVRPAMDRSTRNGFRCVRYLGDGRPPEASTRVVELTQRDYRSETPVSDELFDVYRQRFLYDDQPLDPIVEAVDESNPHWVREKISATSAYDSGRLTLYLFRPRNAVPPYKTVIFYPGTGSTFSDAFDSALAKRERSYVDFVIRSGRALVYTILRATHERNEGLESTWPNESYRYVDYLTCWVKDIRRALDYVVTRDDIDAETLAYFGFSWGARYGAIIPAVETRLKVSVLWSGGLVQARARPEVDQFTYVTRVNVPTLMINGRYDTTHPVETAQKTMIDLIATPAEHKRHVLYDSGHMPPRNALIRETLDWLDRYQGPVQRAPETSS